MKRLIEKTVFLGLVTDCPLATWPTRRSPPLVKATTEGVVRLPSAFGITFASVPSMTATTLFVVPRSIPMILLTSNPPSLIARAPKPQPARSIDVKTLVAPCQLSATPMLTISRADLFLVEASGEPFRPVRGRRTRPASGGRGCWTEGRRTTLPRPTAAGGARRPRTSSFPFGYRSLRARGGARGSAWAARREPWAGRCGSTTNPTPSSESCRRTSTSRCKAASVDLALFSLFRRHRPPTQPSVALAAGVKLVQQDDGR